MEQVIETVVVFLRLGERYIYIFFLSIMMAETSLQDGLGPV